MKPEKELKEEELQENIGNEAAEAQETETVDHAAEAQETPEVTEEDKLAETEAKLAEMQDKYLRQVAEFDNYRKRTMKEKAELILNGAEKTIYGKGGRRGSRERRCGTDFSEIHQDTGNSGCETH